MQTRTGPLHLSRLRYQVVIEALRAEPNLAKLLRTGEGSSAGSVQACHVAAIHDVDELQWGIGYWAYDTGFHALMDAPACCRRGRPGDRHRLSGQRGRLVPCVRGASCDVRRAWASVPSKRCLPRDMPKTILEIERVAMSMGCASGTERKDLYDDPQSSAFEHQIRGTRTGRV